MALVIQMMTECLRLGPHRLLATRAFASATTAAFASSVPGDGKHLSGSWATMNHYQVLGLTPGAAPKEIKSSYYRLSMKYHPDRHTESLVTEGDAHSIFTRINEAYSVLSDATKRKDYDLHRGLGHDGHERRHNSHHAAQPHRHQQQQHQHSGFAKGNPYTHHTDRASYFNFREHYDAHYGRIFKPTRVSNEERAILQSRNFKMVQVFGLVAAIVSTVSLLSSFLKQIL